MRVRWKAGLALLALLGGEAAARAESLWARRSQRYGFLFIDNRARNVGDVLTLILSETTAIGQREQRQLGKTSATSLTINYEGNSSSDGTSRSAAADVDGSVESSRQFNGNAQLQSARVLTDRMALTVIDVLPNGNLVVEGHRVRIIAGERRILRVTGVVRPADLSPVNTVLSEAVANFKIEYLGRGVESKFTNQGWFSQFVNHVWPF